MLSVSGVTFTQTKQNKKESKKSMKFVPFLKFFFDPGLENLSATAMNHIKTKLMLYNKFLFPGRGKARVLV